MTAEELAQMEKDQEIAAEEHKKAQKAAAMIAQGPALDLEAIASGKIVLDGNISNCSLNSKYKNYIGSFSNKTL